MSEHQIEWERMTPAEKKIQLYKNQKNILDLFLERNAISHEQYDKSLRYLTEMMVMQDNK